MDKITFRLYKAIEDKLRELMGDDEYIKWSTETAKRIFKEELETLPDGHPFKEMLDPEIFSAITGSEEEYQSMITAEMDYQDMLNDIGEGNENE